MQNMEKLHEPLHPSFVRRRCAGAATAVAAPAQACEFDVQDVAPWVVSGNPSLKGIQYEIAEAAIKKSGVACTVKAMPPVRINARLQAKESRFVFRNKSAANEAIADFLGEMIVSPVIVVASPGKSVKSYEDLKSLSAIGAVRGVSYGQPFDGDASIKKSEELGLEQALGKMAAGRLDGVVGTSIAIQWSVKAQNLQSAVGDRFKLQNVAQLLATTKGDGQAEDARKMAEAMAAMKNDGTIKEIVDRHVGEGWDR